MNTTAHASTAGRIGHRVARGWRAYVRGERRVSKWLVSEGVPMAGATTLLWVIKLVVFGALLYSAFRLALLLGFTAIVARTAGNLSVQEDDEKAEWRVGWSGYGLYRGETRVDPGLDNDN